MGKKYELGNLKNFREITVPDGMELIIDNNGQARVVPVDYSVEAVSDRLDYSEGYMPKAGMRVYGITDETEENRLKCINEFLTYMKFFNKKANDECTAECEKLFTIGRNGHGYEVQNRTLSSVFLFNSMEYAAKVIELMGKEKLDYVFGKK